MSTLATIKEVAKLAKVSIATVSRVTNYDETLSISNETRQRIWHAVNVLGYNKGKKPVKQKERKIGEILLITSFTQHEELHTPYYRSIRQGIERQCKKHNLKIANAVYINQHLDFTALSLVDGIVIIGQLADEDIDSIRMYNPNVIVLNTATKLEDIDVVGSDCTKATEQAVTHLIEKGHSHIGFIGGKVIIKKISTHTTFQQEDERQLAFEKMMKKRKTYHEEDIYVGHWRAIDGYKLMKKAIEKGNLPSAFVIANDELAIGALRALHEHQIKVPQEVALISFEDIEDAKFMTPSLSTMRVHTEEIGKTAINLLQERLNGRTIPVKMYLSTQLIERESC